MNTKDAEILQPDDRVRLISGGSAKITQIIRGDYGRAPIILVTTDSGVVLPWRAEPICEVRRNGEVIWPKEQQRLF